MKIGLFGNCQAAAIGRILNDFLPEHEVIVFKAVHTMSEKDKLEMLQKIKSLDALVHQPVGEVYHPASTEMIKKQLEGTHVKSILFPVLYFSGYFYDVIYLKDRFGKTVRDFVTDYHSRIIFSSFAHGLTFDHCNQLYHSDNNFIKEQALKMANASIEELSKREASCDIKISHMVKELYQNKNCFFTFNHPTGHILYPVVDDILRSLGQNTLTPEVKKDHASILGNVFWHGMVSIEKSLGLTFQASDCFYINNRKYTLKEFYDVSTDFYSKHSWLIECNKNMIMPRAVFDIK